MVQNLRGVPLRNLFKLITSAVNKLFFEHYLEINPAKCFTVRTNWLT